MPERATENPVAATHFIHADRPRQTAPKEGGPPMPDPEHLTGAGAPGEHADDPQQGPGATQSKHTTSATESARTWSR